MRKYGLLLLLVLSGFAGYGQSNAFKTREKNKSGTYNPAFTRQKINAASGLKSASNNRYPVVKDLETPAEAAHKKPLTKVISKDGSPVYIERKAAAAKAGPEERLYKFLSETGSVTGVVNPREIFRISGIGTDDVGVTHIRTVQQHRGIDIYGSESIVHLDSVNERFTGSFRHPSQDTRTVPDVTAGGAVDIVTADVRQVTVYKELSANEKKILDYVAPEYSLVLYEREKDDFRLCWAVIIRPNFLEEWKYFIDAGSGEILKKWNNTNSDGPATATAVDLNGVLRSLGTYLETGTYYMMNASESMYDAATGEGVILTLDADNTSTSSMNYKYVTSTNNSWTQKSAVSAHYNATAAYRYFKTTHNRNSINGQGGNIISFVNVAEDDGTSMQNAFWNGKAVFYGNGGSYFLPLAGALDVAAHELGHGVVTNTANLEYYGQSGAINESYADIFGAMVDREDWLIGEDITKTSFSPSGALRNMADPHNQGSSLSQPYWQPKTVTEMYLGTEDNGGVHINSGIGNYAYYLFATSVTKEKAEKVFYRALENYLTKTSQFIDLRIAVIQAASDLYGASSQEVLKAAEAFTAVGIQEEQQVDKSQDYTVNPGQEYLLSYDTDDSDPSTLFRSSVTGTDFLALTNTIMKGKVSVTDNGSIALFVSSDSKLKYLSLNPADPGEFVLSEDPFWDNVAISKNGKRLAAISTEIDSSIYVYDFESGKWATFILYNPTTSQFNTDAGGVLYADAIEFDATGQYLIYDACNVFRSTTGEDIYYWDIGFINVWNNNAGVFGDGSVSKLYGSLPENVSIGNPVFSKNSPSVIAFDYFDNVAGEYAIYGADLNSGEVNLIYVNNTLGYPSFSKNDGKIAFSKLSSGESRVAHIGLGADKISPSGGITELIGFAKWPVYYANGGRSLGLPPVADFTADVRSGKVPLQVKYMDLSTNKPSSWSWSFEGGNPATSVQQNPTVSYSTAGTFKVTLTAGNSDGTDTFTKNGYIVVTTATGTEDAALAGMLIYPNPVGDRLTVISDGNFVFTLFDMEGNMVLSCEGKREIDMSVVKPGIYILEIKTESDLIRQKIVKK